MHWMIFFAFQYLVMGFVSLDFSESDFTMLFTSAMFITGKNLANKKNAVKNNPR